MWLLTCSPDSTQSHRLRDGGRGTCWPLAGHSQVCTAPTWQCGAGATVPRTSPENVPKQSSSHRQIQLQNCTFPEFLQKTPVLSVWPVCEAQRERTCGWYVVPPISGSSAPEAWYREEAPREHEQKVQVAGGLAGRPRRGWERPTGGGGVWTKQVMRTRSPHGGCREDRVSCRLPDEEGSPTRAPSGPDVALLITART